MEKETFLSPWYNGFIPRNQIPISKPFVEGFFSIDGKRNYINSAINLKYLKLPNKENINFDLNEGYNAAIKRPENYDPKIDHLLQFILHNKAKLIRNSKDSPLIKNTDFICYRGLLRLVMGTPYEYKDDWNILVTKYKGNIYLCQKETEAKKKRMAEESEHSKKICSYGFKFEQFILVDSPGHIANTKCPVNECEEFSCVFRTKLDNFKLFYGAEIDGINSPHEVDISSSDPEKLEFIEIKACLRNTYHQKINFLRFKLRNWWCQSFLVGINNILVGFRNEDGIVKEIDALTLKRMVELGRNYWSPIVCLDFLHKFLAMVQKIVENNDCPYSVYEFYWDPKTRKNISYKFHKGKTELTFLPDWYINEFEN